MKKITFRERDKHGCWDCVDKVLCGRDGYKCPYETCPYQEIDEYDSYDEYLEETKGDTPLEFFLPRGGRRAMKYKIASNS